MKKLLKNKEQRFVRAATFLVFNEKRKKKKEEKSTYKLKTSLGPKEK